MRQCSRAKVMGGGTLSLLLHFRITMGAIIIKLKRTANYQEWHEDLKGSCSTYLLIFFYFRVLSKV